MIPLSETVTLALYLLGVPAIAACVYLAFLTLLSGALPKPARPSHRLHFEITVPAHNESSVITRTLDSLQAVDWPARSLRIVVVADNCTDNTADLARAAGATVLERHDTEQRGKGYALQHAFAASRAAGWADAIVVVDADSVVTPNLLEALAARIEQGAGVVQAHYGVLNPNASWRTRLISIAHGSFHVLRSRAREQLKLSCGLRGNGWCITQKTLQAVPYRAFSLTEDLEYGIALGLAGHRVHYASEANVDAEMTTSASVADTQRRRWEHGRFALIRQFAWPLLRRSWQQRNPVCLDLSLDLLTPPLASVATMTLLFTCVALAAAISGASSLLPLALALICVAVLVTYVLRGWQLSGIGKQGLLSLVYAPFFICWKMASQRRGALTQWSPTQREAP